MLLPRLITIEKGISRWLTAIPAFFCNQGIFMGVLSQIGSKCGKSGIFELNS